MKIKTLLLLLIVVGLISSPLTAQQKFTAEEQAELTAMINKDAPKVGKLACKGVLWQYLTNANKKIMDLAVLPDGSVIVAGEELKGFVEWESGWLVKVSPTGKVIWEKTFNSMQSEGFDAVALTADGGFLVAGEKGDAVWVLRLDKSAKVIWELTLDDLKTPTVEQIISMKDGGAVLVGTTLPAEGNFDSLVIRLDRKGKVLWRKNLGLGGPDHIKDVLEIDGSELLLVGWVLSKETPKNKALYTQLRLIKLTAKGITVWEKLHGGTGHDDGVALLKLDKGYLTVEQTSSKGPSTTNGWVLKLNVSGVVQQEFVFGKDGWDDLKLLDVAPMKGGYVSCGELLIMSHTTAGYGDLYCMTMNNKGAVTWETSCGSVKVDKAFAVESGPDGSFFVAGSFCDVMEDHCRWVIMKIKPEK